MNALNPLQPATPTGVDPRVSEPSMEEILASIRRIIADDQSLPLHARGSAANMADDADDVPPSSPAAASATTTLDENAAPRPEQTHAAQIAPAAEPVLAGRDDGPGARADRTVDLREVAVEPNADASAGPSKVPHDSDSLLPRPSIEESVVPEPDLETADEPASLFSAATDHSVTAAFNVLAASRIADQSDELLQLVRGMIRPLLKAWIDENVPALVERMIRAEIERMTRGGR